MEHTHRGARRGSVPVAELLAAHGVAASPSGTGVAFLGGGVLAVALVAGAVVALSPSRPVPSTAPLATGTAEAPQQETRAHAGVVPIADDVAAPPRAVPSAREAARPAAVVARPWSEAAPERAAEPASEPVAEPVAEPAAQPRTVPAGPSTTQAPGPARTAPPAMSVRQDPLGPLAEPVQRLLGPVGSVLGD